MLSQLDPPSLAGFCKGLPGLCAQADCEALGWSTKGASEGLLGLSSKAALLAKALLLCPARQPG